MKNWYELTKTYLILAISRLKDGKIITAYEELEEIEKRFSEKIFEVEDEEESTLQEMRRDLLSATKRLRKGELIDAYLELEVIKDKLNKAEEKISA